MVNFFQFSTKAVSGSDGYRAQYVTIVLKSASRGEIHHIGEPACLTHIATSCRDWSLYRQLALGITQLIVAGPVVLPIVLEFC